MTNGYVPIDEVAGQGKAYRLWRKPPITAGNPIIILVHGAVVPMLVPNVLHDPNTINNEKYCFYQLDSLLYNDFHYNVFTFEYADWPILDRGSVNYHVLAPYGESLIDAIGIAKEKSMTQGGTVGPVYVIAHSVGGLIARYAVQDPRVRPINKIITLDTGHRGFELAKIADEIVVDPLKALIPLPTPCSEDAAPNSDFVNALNAGFAACPPLVSLAATQPIPPSGLGMELPPIPITVVDLESSNMGQVHPLPYNHMSIAQIRDASHGAYQIIRRCFG